MMPFSVSILAGSLFFPKVVAETVAMLKLRQETCEFEASLGHIG